MADGGEPSSEGGSLEPKGVCLCVVFNHPYVAHLDVLRRIYRERFRHVRFLVPLKRMPDADVITVYRGSFVHNAYLTDAAAELSQLACSHYLFVHDDIIFHPALDEENVLEALGVRGSNDAFIPHVDPIPEDVGDWGHALGPLWRALHSRNYLAGTGVDSIETVLAQLPPPSAARERLARYGARPQTVLRRTTTTLDDSKDVARITAFGGDAASEARLREALINGLYKDASELIIDYPFLMTKSASDFCVVPRSSLPEIAHYSGVLAAAGLFVEMTYGTVLALATDTLVQMKDRGLHVDLASLIRGYQDALGAFEDDPALLAIHPLKLSTVSDIDGFAAAMKRARSLPFGRAAAAERLLRKIRAAQPEFESEAYLAANPDVRAAGVPPERHYWVHGRHEGRRIRP